MFKEKQVRKLQTSHQIWEKLKAQYEPKINATQSAHTLRAYFTLTMKEDDDVDNNHMGKETR